MNNKQKALYNYQINLFDKIYSYMKANLEKELKIENFEINFKITWLKTWMDLKTKYEKSIKKQTEMIKIDKH
jgi:hypothetical protein